MHVKESEQVLWFHYLDSLTLRRLHSEDDIVVLLVEFDSLDVVEDTEEMCLDGVGVTCLTQDLQQGRVRHKEEPWEQQPLLLQVPDQQQIRLVAHL